MVAECQKDSVVDWVDGRGPSLKSISRAALQLPNSRPVLSRTGTRAPGHRAQTGSAGTRAPEKTLLQK